MFQSSFSKQTARQELEESYESLVVPFRTSLDTPASQLQKQPSPGPSDRAREAADTSSMRQSKESSVSEASVQEISPVADIHMSQEAREQHVEVTYRGEDQALDVSCSPKCSA